MDGSARAARLRHGARTALYLRVSTADQEDPDLQCDGLRGYAERAGLEVVQDYCDVAVSGRREGRPQLNALMAAARNREIDCVLVWKFDRFARSTRHLLTALEEFDHLGVRFVSVQDQIDIRQPDGPRDVHHHWSYGRTEILADQRARDRGHARRSNPVENTSDARGRQARRQRDRGPRHLYRSQRPSNSDKIAGRPAGPLSAR